MAREIEEIILKISLDNSQVKKDLAGLKSQANNTFSAGILGKKIDPFKPVSDGANKVLKKLPPIKTGFKDVNSAIRSTMKEATVAAAALDKAGDSAKNSGKKAKTSAKGYSLLSGAIKTIAVSLVIAKLKKLGKEALNVNEKFTKITNSLRSTFGQDAGKQFEFVSAKAEELAVDLLGAGAGFAKFAAAAKGAGLLTEDVQEGFSGAADAAGALSLSGDDLNGILRAMSQIASKGALQTEDLNQIAERGIPVFKLAAEAIGANTGELRKMMEQGKIASGDFLPKFAAQLKKTYHEGALKNAGTELAKSTLLQNRWNTQLNKGGAPLREITNTLGGAFLTAWEAITDTIADGIVAVAQINGTLDTLAGPIVKVTKKNNELSASNKKVAASARKANAALKELADIGADISKEQDLDKIRKELGLTEKGFERFRDTVKKGIDKGGLNPLGEIKDMEKIRDIIKQSIDLLTKEQKIDFFRVDLDLKTFIKDIKDFPLALGFEDMQNFLEDSKNNPLELGFEDVKNFIQDLKAHPLTLAFGFAKGFLEEGGVGEFDKKEKKKKPKKLQAPTEALESRSAEALRFAARPVEKDMKAIAEEQLTVQQGMATSMEQIAANPPNFNTAGL
jgi:tape measure domain-containing protein